MMKSSPERKPTVSSEISETSYDFFTARKLLHAIGAHGDSRSLKYYLYVALVIAVHFYLIAMSAITICVISKTKKVTMDACHIFLLVSFSAHCLITRHATRRSLKKSILTIKSGVYLYENEEVIEEHYLIKKANVTLIRKITESFNILLYIAAVCNAIVIPVLQAFLFQGTLAEEELNPYLPKPFFMPFNTKTTLGFIIGYCFNLFFFFYLIFTVACMNEIYLSCTLQLKAQLQILNHSLKNIDRRAYGVYRKYSAENGQKEEIGDLFSSEMYQKCLYQCLRSNVQHHQAILNLRKTFHSYTGSCVLDNIAIASLILAASLFLVLEEPGFYEFIILAFTLVAEMLYTFQCCVCGELVLQEGNELFFSLYATPWIHCNVRFNRILRIMMCYMRSPIKIQAVGFDFSASLETFGEIISGMYKFMNLARQESTGFSS